MRARGPPLRDDSAPTPLPTPRPALLQQKEGAVECSLFNIISTDAGSRY